jgi:serine/threonine protein kinase
MAESRSSSMVSFSLLYAAPEQVSPKRFGQADKRTDIYQLGTIMYKTATKTTPFSGDDITEVMGKIINDDPDTPSLINPEAAVLDPIILKCLAKKKEARYQKIEDLEKDLSKCLEQEFTQSWQNSTGSTARSVYFIAKLLQLHIQNEQAADALQDCLNLKIYSQNTDLAELIDELQYLAEREIGIDQGLKKKAEATINKILQTYKKEN